MSLTSEQAALLGQRSGYARRTLTWADVEDEMPPLTSLDNIQEAYDRIARWSAGGLITNGACAGAAIGAT